MLPVIAFWCNTSPGFFSCTTRCRYPAPGIWSPYTSKDVLKIKQVQKNDARFVTNNYHPRASTSELVSQLNWDSLENRRLFAQAVTFYKISNNLVNINFPPEVQPNLRLTRTNSLKFKQIQSNVLAYNYSFYPRTVRTWKLLSTKVAGTPTIKIFKSITPCQQ